MNFWQKLKKPIIGLSPMDGVSDVSFRFITAKYGKPDVITTEFISIDGIAYAAPRLFDDFLYHEIERPVVAQIFGIEPEYFYQAAQIICELGFDGVDINMGCPAKTVSRRGAGAGLIQNPTLAKEIVLATKKGVEDWQRGGLSSTISAKVLKEMNTTKGRLEKLGVKFPLERQLIPVSVKTRIGYSEVQVREWIPHLLEGAPANITIHGRTLKQMYQGLADWEALSVAGEIISDYNSGQSEEHKITYIANGDVDSAVSAKEKLEKSKADGLYIGRASYGNPWIFKQIKDNLSGAEVSEEELSLETKAKVAYEHALLHFDLKGESGFIQMRKHLAWYLRGFPGAVKLRVSLMQANSPEEVRNILNENLDLGL